MKLTSLNKKLNSNKTKYFPVKNELIKLQAFDLSYFRGKSHSENNGTQFVKPMNKYFKRIIGVGNGEYIYFEKSKRWSDERIYSITTAHYSITPSLDYFGAKIRVKFHGSFLKQDKITYNHGK